jgi:hypothetical protein
LLATSDDPILKILPDSIDAEKAGPGECAWPGVATLLALAS